MRYSGCDFSMKDLEEPIKAVDAALKEIKRRVADRDCSPPSVRKLYRFIVKCEENCVGILKTLDRLDEEYKEELKEEETL